ncbi:hypothetical protein QA601_14105 [Chitinispirillales bacterium ANBcel5]|uniref:hypothetical protein n=1 Tax=Cellulosispirillum alkaliphilum TaxID=3039283 RepID=UPI002A5319F4|nr:hypothetical protein [Chitinispirillales bacterium ANBcel5]
MNRTLKTISMAVAVFMLVSGATARQAPAPNAPSDMEQHMNRVMEDAEPVLEKVRESVEEFQTQRARGRSEEFIAERRQQAEANLNEALDKLQQHMEIVSERVRENVSEQARDRMQKRVDQKLLEIRQIRERLDLE